MHNLRRVAAGLRGEYLEPEIEEDEEEEGAEKATATATTQKKTDNKAKAVEESANEGWQPMSEYEREEGRVEVGEIGDRDNFVAAGVEEPVVHVVGEDVVAGQKRKGGEEKLDKEARKKAKKERNKEFKRKKAEKGNGGDDDEE